MKITLTQRALSEREYTATSGGEDIEAIIETFKGLLVQAGYHPRTVDDHVVTSNQWFEDDQKSVTVSQAAPYNIKTIRD